MLLDSCENANPWRTEVASSGISTVNNTLELDTFGAGYIPNSSTNYLIQASSDMQYVSNMRANPVADGCEQTPAGGQLKFNLENFGTNNMEEYSFPCFNINTISTPGNTVSQAPQDPISTIQPLSPPVNIEDVLAAIENDPLFTQQRSDNSNLNCELMLGETGDSFQYERQLNQARNIQNFSGILRKHHLVVAQDDNREKTLKDKKYWERRRKNNLAAKRSRAAKRNRQLAVEHATSLLRKDNISLHRELLTLREENASLKRFLQFF